MYSFATYKEQYKANLRLALPVVLTQLGQILTQVADNLMVGRYGGSDPTPLAAVSFGGAVFFILFVSCDLCRIHQASRTAFSSTDCWAWRWPPCSTPSSR